MPERKDPDLEGIEGRAAVLDPHFRATQKKFADLLSDCDQLLDGVFKAPQLASFDGIRDLLAVRNELQGLINHINRNGHSVIIDGNTYWEVSADGKKVRNLTDLLNLSDPNPTVVKQKGESPQSASKRDLQGVGGHITRDIIATAVLDESKTRALKNIMSEFIRRTLKEVSTMKNVPTPSKSPEATNPFGDEGKTDIRENPALRPKLRAPKAAPSPVPKTVPARSPAPDLRLLTKPQPFITEEVRTLALQVMAVVGIGGGTLLGAYDLYQNYTASGTPDQTFVATSAPSSSDDGQALATVEKVVGPKVVVTAPDGVPADASKALTTKDPVPQVVTIDGDGEQGTLPEGAVGFVVTNPDGSAIPAPAFTPKGSFEKVVKLVADDNEIPDIEKKLYVAAVNSKRVKQAAPEDDLSVLMKNIKDTPEALTIIREKNLAWGGWEGVWEGVDAENARRSTVGEAIIDQPSEYIAYLAHNEVFPNAHALAVKAARDSSLIVDSRVVENPSDVRAKVAEVEKLDPQFLAELKVDKPDRPEAWSLESSDSRMGLYDASQFAPENSEMAQLWMQDSNEDTGESVRAVELPADPFNVPEPQHVKPLSESQIALVESNRVMRASLTGLRNSLPALQEEAYKRARGANRFGVGALFTNFGINLDKVISNPENLSVEDQKLALVELRETFVAELTQLNEGRDGYAAYLREATRKVFMGLANAWDVLPRDENNSVFEVTEGTRRAALATLPNIFA